MLVPVLAQAKAKPGRAEPRRLPCPGLARHCSRFLISHPKRAGYNVPMLIPGRLPR